MRNSNAKSPTRIAANGRRPGAAGRRRAASCAASIAAEYSYNFSWLGRPIIQYPQDVVAMQELIWRCSPT